MRFYVGVTSMIFSIVLIISTILFIDYSDLFEKLFSALLYIISAILMLLGIRNLSTFYDYKRILMKGVRVKAKVLNVKSTILAVKNAPKLILEVIYEHPKNHLKYKTFVDFYGDADHMKYNIKENEFIEVLVDPKDPSVALFSTY